MLMVAWQKAGPFILKERVLNPASGPEFLSLFEAFAAKAGLFTPEIGQRLIAKWLAKDSRGRTSLNRAEKIAARQRHREKAYLEAMGRDLLSDVKSEGSHNHSDHSGAATGPQE
jgi:hypothetical protein